MANDAMLYEQYSSEMLKHGYGHAFYEPALSKEVLPGTCGYLDESGRFCPILNLSSKDIVEEGFEEFEEPKRLQPKSRIWGVRTSANVESKRVNLGGGASALPAGLPVSASFIYNFSSQSDFGAVLVCPEAVVQEGYAHKAPFREWAKRNAARILRQYPDVVKHGFFIVTTTESTSSAAINAWTKSGNEISIGFKVDVMQAGNLESSVAWYKERTAGGWVVYDDLKTQKVVFFGGLYFKFRKIIGGITEITQGKDWNKFRSHKGTEQDAPLHLSDERDPSKKYEVTREELGPESEDENDVEEGDDNEEDEDEDDF